MLFCDLVGSTALSAQLDPEDLREVVRAYQEACAKLIARYEGHIAQYLDDGLLVYFGYPLAHEDDAQRAVRAGLSMVEAVGQLNTRLAAVKALAQLGATLGREFSYDLLQAVAPWDEATVQGGLQQLVVAELLYQQGLPPQATYRFKHALIQEAAYQSLLKSTRQQYH